MKKLVLHSNQVEGKTQVDEAFVRLLASKKRTIGYIPSQSDAQRRYFNKTVSWYKQFGITDVLYFDVDQEYDENKLNALLRCDAIHLSGGNTYYFLHSLKKHNLLPKLRSFVEKGGVLIGVSAGSMIMSKTIALTTVDDDLGGDQNTVGLRDLSALGVSDFEFFPHFDGKNEEILRRLKRYSEKIQSVIYACGDGDGIVVHDGNTRFIGDVVKIQKGRLQPVS